MDNTLAVKKFRKVYRRIPWTFWIYYVFTNAWALFCPTNLC